MSLLASGEAWPDGAERQMRFSLNNCHRTFSAFLSKTFLIGKLTGITAVAFVATDGCLDYLHTVVYFAGNRV